jgi:hypothetical protein
MAGDATARNPKLKSRLRTHELAMAEPPEESEEGDVGEAELDKHFEEGTPVVQTTTDDGAVFIEGKRKTRSPQKCNVELPVAVRVVIPSFGLWDRPWVPRKGSSIISLS